MSSKIVGIIARLVAREQAGLVARIGGFIDGALALGEREVKAALASIRNINGEARQHVKDLQVLHSESGEQREIAAAVLGRQALYCGEAVALLKQQVEVAQRSLALSQEIAGFVAVIGSISNAARILTVNGQIESVRMGEKGSAFAVIANQMRDLSREVNKANGAISDLAGRLGDLMPKLAGNAGALLATTEEFSMEQAQQVARFQAATDRETQQLERALRQCSGRAERILSESGAMLTHLQFQDRMGQELRQVEDLSRDGAALVGEFLALLSQQTGPEPELHQVEEALRLARQKVTTTSRRLSDHSPGAAVEVPADGVMLF